MKNLFGGKFIVSIIALAQVVRAGGADAELEQKLATVKESIAQNQAALHQYTWTEQTTVSLKGEAKKTQQAVCRFGPDGKVQKTPVGVQTPPPQRAGLRGKVVENKTDELKDYMQRAAELIREYVPPSPEAMQAAFQAGKASLQRGAPGTVQLRFNDYYKAGDSLMLTFSTAGRKLEAMNVNTSMDQNDPVTLAVTFAALPGGPNHVESTVLSAPAKQIQVKTQNSNYQKLGS